MTGISNTPTRSSWPSLVGADIVDDRCAHVDGRLCTADHRMIVPDGEIHCCARGMSGIRLVT